MKETYISVDVETAGRDPRLHCMYEIGACVVDDPRLYFFAGMRPDRRRYEPEALAACRRTWADLQKTPDHARSAMPRFAEWVADVSKGTTPVMTGFAAGFDWLFVDAYLQRYVGRNPFGICPLDIKSFYMGLTGCSWDETRSSRLDPRFRSDLPHTHSALDDALEQADMFRKMRAMARPLPP